MLTIAQAKAIRPGTMLYSTRSYNKKGQPHAAKVTSIKTWKTRPLDVLISWKHGLYTYGKTDQTQLDQWALTLGEALDARA